MMMVYRTRQKQAERSNHHCHHFQKQATRKSGMPFWIASLRSQWRRGRNNEQCARWSGLLFRYERV